MLNLAGGTHVSMDKLRWHPGERGATVLKDRRVPSCLMQSRHNLCDDVHPAQDQSIETPDRARLETGGFSEKAPSF